MSCLPFRAAGGIRELSTENILSGIFNFIFYNAYFKINTKNDQELDRKSAYILVSSIEDSSFRLGLPLPGSRIMKDFRLKCKVKLLINSLFPIN